MDIRQILLDTRGRMAPRDFWRGLIVLTMAMTLVVVAENTLSPAFGILQYALIFNYVAVFGKRLHDAGYSSWFWFAFLIGYLFIATGSAVILLPLVSPDTWQLMYDLTETLQTQGEKAFAEALEPHQETLPQHLAVPRLIGIYLATAMLGLLAARLPAEAGPNRYGAPVS